MTTSDIGTLAPAGFRIAVLGGSASELPGEGRPGVVTNSTVASVFRHTNAEAGQVSR